MEFKLVKIHTKLRLLNVLYRFLFTLCIASTSYATDPIDQRTADEARKLINQGLESTIGFEVVKSLTTEVGPRLAGTKAEARAELGCCKIQRARIFKHTNRTIFC